MGDEGDDGECLECWARMKVTPGVPYTEPLDDLRLAGATGQRSGHLLDKAAGQRARGIAPDTGSPQTPPD